MQAAGATYVARSSVTQRVALINSVERALQTRGFSFIEALTPCPVQFGRRNQLGAPADMLKSLVDKCVMKEDAENLSSEELKGKIITGEFSDGCS